MAIQLIQLKEIKVLMLIDKPRATARPNKNKNNIRVSEIGQTVDLSCDYSNEPDVKWRKTDSVRFKITLTKEYFLKFQFKELSDYSREFEGKLLV